VLKNNSLIKAQLTHTQYLL